MSSGWSPIKNLPTGPSPNRMTGRPQARSAKPQAARLLEILDHLLRFVPVLTDYQMHMIGHNCAPVASVPIFAYRLAEPRRDLANRRSVEFLQAKAKHIFRSRVKLPNRPRRRLNPPTALMKFAKFGDNIDADCPRATSSRIGRQPPPVSGQNQMMCNYNRSSHDNLPIKAVDYKNTKIRYCKMNINSRHNTPVSRNTRPPSPLAA